MQYVINKMSPVEDEVYKSESSEEYVDLCKPVQTLEEIQADRE